MEGMICGKPIIASNNRGHRELIKDDINGKLVDLKKEDAFYENICLLIENEDIRNRFSVNSLQLVEPFKIENVKKELIKIY